jgi:hypothetical protein
MEMLLENVAVAKLQGLYRHYRGESDTGQEYFRARYPSPRQDLKHGASEYETTTHSIAAVSTTDSIVN